MFHKLALLVLVAATALGAPTTPQVTDTDVLQFALTLEHLENTFYSQALAKYNAQAFEKAGFPPFVRARVAQIASHEAEHVKFLSGALGANATKPCEYNFMHTDPRSFLAISMVLETVGGSAYQGAAGFLSNKDTLTAAASILAVESRHASWISSAVLKLQPWNGAFDTPLLPSGVFSLAAQFIKSCPSTNPPLPVKAFPALTLSTGSPAHGAKISASFTPAGDKKPGQVFIVWLDGISVQYSVLGSDGKTTVPDGLAGTVYAAAVSTKDQTPSDAILLSGFAVVQFPFSSGA